MLKLEQDAHRLVLHRISLLLQRFFQLISQFYSQYLISLLRLMALVFVFLQIIQLLKFHKISILHKHFPKVQDQDFYEFLVPNQKIILEISFSCIFYIFKHRDIEFFTEFTEN